jgi:hypothetical protein
MGFVDAHTRFTKLPALHRIDPAVVAAGISVP